MLPREVGRHGFIPEEPVDGLKQGSLVPARAVADGTAAVARMVLPSAPGLVLTNAS